jgi:hypothetical protein
MFADDQQLGLLLAAEGGDLACCPPGSRIRAYPHGIPRAATSRTCCDKRLRATNGLSPAHSSLS